jgi:hypothetical protein
VLRYRDQMLEKGPFRVIRGRPPPQRRSGPFALGIKVKEDSIDRLYHLGTQGNTLRRLLRQSKSPQTWCLLCAGDRWERELVPRHRRFLLWLEAPAESGALGLSRTFPPYNAECASISLNKDYNQKESNSLLCALFLASARFLAGTTEMSEQAGNSLPIRTARQ